MTASLPLATATSEPALSRRELLRDTLSGKLRIVGWGATAFVRYHLMQCPAPIAYIIDVDPEKWGTSHHGIDIKAPAALASETARGTVIMTFVHPDLIRDAVARYGDFHIIPPFQVDEDVALIRSILAERPATVWPSWALHFGKLISPSATRRRRAALRRVDAARRREDRPAVERRATLMFFRLFTGGADRQICNLAVGLRERGWDVELVGFREPDTGTDHYVRMLEAAGVPLHIFPGPRQLPVEQLVEGEDDAVGKEVVAFASHLPVPIMHYTLTAKWHLENRRPTLVVSYLDYMNTIAIFSGLLAGVPRILVSGRNLHPGHFPHYYANGTEWIRRIYRVGLRFPQVVMTANSAAGAASYTKWLRTTPDKVQTIPNGVRFDRTALENAEALFRIRAEMGAAPDDPLIVGVFRLAPEKRPLAFIQILARLVRRFPTLRAAIIGEGPMRPQIEAAISAEGLNEHVRLIGVRDDVAPYMMAANLVLHTAEAEGIPNVIVEAQLLARPVACTLGGGTGECLAVSLQPFAREVGDDEGLAEAAAALIDNPALACNAAEKAFADVSRRFSIEALVDNTLSACNLQRRSDQAMNSKGG